MRWGAKTVRPSPPLRGKGRGSLVVPPRSTALLTLSKVARLAKALGASKVLTEDTADTPTVGKQENDMDPRLSVAKAVAATGRPAPLYSKGDWYAEIQKRAEARKQEGESPAQAFSRFIQKHPEGRILYEAYRRTPGVVSGTGPRHVAKATEPTPVPSYTKLMVKAAELRKSKPDLSEAQAFAKVFGDPANRD